MALMDLPIHTARLVLRRFAPADLEAFQAYRSDPVLARYQEWTPLPADQAMAFLTEQAQRVLGVVGEWLQVAVTRRDTGELVGDLGLCVVDQDHGVVELGFTVARCAQGCGYATEAVSSALTALWKAQIRSVLAVTDTRNAPSVALLRRLGFTLERTATTLFRGEDCHEHTFVYTAPGYAHPAV